MRQRLVCIVTGIFLTLGGARAGVQDRLEDAVIGMPFADARAIIDVLRPELLPAELRGTTSSGGSRTL